MTPSRRARDLLFIGALLFLLAALTIGAALFESRNEREIALDSSSSAPDGAQALYLWLDAIGFTVQNTADSAFAIPEDTDAVFIFEPLITYQFTESEVEDLGEWVQAGGHLIFASENPTFSPLAKHFGFQSVYLSDAVETSLPPLPVLVNPPLTTPISMTINSYFETEVEDFVPLVAISEGPVIISTQVGEGTVILSTGTNIFENEGLKSTGSAEVVLNLLGELPEGANIWFDEWHHGKRMASESSGGPTDWLRSTAAGHALVFTAGVLFIWVLLSGRQFGRTIQLQNHTRRTPIEYVRAIANLNQRAGNRENLLAHYHQLYKRRLAQRYPVDAGLSDDEFLSRLEETAPEVDVTTVKNTLNELSNANVSESELIKRISESIEQKINNR